MDLSSLDTTLSQMRSSQSVMGGIQKAMNTSLGEFNGDLATTPTGQTMASFGNLLTNEMDKINALEATAHQNVENYASGGNVPLHQVIMSVEKADMALQLATQVRNRLIGAYQEISRMQV